MQVRLAWHDYAFKTKLEVTEDSRDPKRLTTAFKLLQSVRVLHRVHRNSPPLL